MRSDDLELGIARCMGERTGRPCLLVPSARFALYLAFTALLAPGAKILMSPVTDDVIFFVVLAAGLQPVLAPVSRRDGNIDPDAVTDDVWAGIGGVLTTNLYGLPDRVVELRRRCDVLSIPLIEDAAHAIDSSVAGRRVGSFGDAAAFSFSKHLMASAGGVLVVPDPGTLARVTVLRDTLLHTGSGVGALREIVEPDLKRLVRGLGVRAPALRAHRALRLDGRVAYRMPVRPELLARRIETAGRHAGGTADEGLAALDPWVRVDCVRYRTRLHGFELRRIATRLAAIGESARPRRRAVERLRELDTVAPAVRDAAAGNLFRVPFLVEDRDEVRAELERKGVVVGHLYDPPLDDYAGPAFAVPSTAPDAARWYSSHVLPIDPRDADRAHDVVRQARPAADHRGPADRSAPSGSSAK